MACRTDLYRPYTGNLPFDHGSPAINHIWTLATEEQFYLLWPIVLVLGLRWRKLWWVIGGSAIAILAVCVASLAYVAPNYGDAYTLPSSWAVTILIGAAAYFAQDRISSWLPKRGRLIAPAAIIALVAMSLIPNFKDSIAAYLLGGPAIAVLTVLVVNYVRQWQRVNGMMRPMLWLGTISYAAYLWNLPVALWLEVAGVPFGALLSLPLTIAAATVSWYAVERPMRELKRRIERRERGLGDTAAVAPRIVA
ncbi:acyltransferase family protein [Microbacterium telephonicum]|uniref:acyltransferase family protein n=1 Tax=Microbacterium telephonicum TaxID=1714841 RepID=UPI000EAFFE88|nr:acyltransferase [Microbacterium telephonicum]